MKHKAKLAFILKENRIAIFDALVRENTANLVYFLRTPFYLSCYPSYLIDYRIQRKHYIVGTKGIRPGNVSKDLHCNRKEIRKDGNKKEHGSFVLLR